MDDVTQIIKKPDVIHDKPGKVTGESHIYNLSVRSFLAILVTLTICTLVLFEKAIDQNFFMQWGMMVAFLFGQANKPKTQ